MSLLTRWIERRSHPRQGDPVLVKIYGGTDSNAGVQVNENTATGWTALTSGIRWLSETIAGLPLKVHRRTRRGVEDMEGTRLWNLLHDEPNPEQTSVEWRALMQSHAVLWGNAYSQIEFNKGGEPIALWPLNPDRVKKERDQGGRLWYRVTLPGNELGSISGFAMVPADEMLHIPGPTRWGLVGEATTEVFQETIGLGLATQQFAARFFGSGLHAGGILTHPEQLSLAAQERLEKSISRQVGGMSNAHRLLILEEGMKWQQVTIDPEKAQFLDTQKFMVAEASRMLRIAPHILYDLDRATFSNITQQRLEVLQDTLNSWLKRWEQRLKKHLVSTKLKNQVYVKFDVNGFLRADTETRFKSYAVGRQWGWLSANDVRELEDLNPRAGGDSYLEPQNMVLVQPDGTFLPLSQAGVPEEEPDEPEDEEEPSPNGDTSERIARMLKE